MSRVTPESKVKAKVKRILERIPNRPVYGWWPVPAGYGRNSLDFVGCIDGQFFAIETKAPGERPTALQQNVINTIRQAGGVVFVIDDTDAYPVSALEAWLNYMCE